MKKDNFDLEILENADNEVIDELNSFPSADEATKRRVFSMSEKKYNDLNSNFEITEENSVNGVEKYSKPKWYRAACAAAAALVLVGGGTATFAALHNTRKSNESMQAASEVETTFDVQEADDKTVTTQLSEVEMKCIYEKLFNPYMAIRRGSDTDRNDPDQEYITFYYYFCDAADYGVSVFKSEDFPCELKEQDGKMYAGLKFYRINNPDFHTIAGMKEVMGQYVSEKFYEKSNCYFECDGISEFDFDNYEDGDVIEDVGNFGEIIQYRDQLYTLMYEPDSFDPENCEVTYEKAFTVNESSFVWECYYHLNDDPENIEVVNALIEMDDSGEWKISKVALGQCSYEMFKNYNGEATPSLMTDIYYKSADNKTEPATDVVEVPVEVTTELNTENVSEVITEKTEQTTVETSEEKEPVTADPAKTVSDYSEEELMNVANTLVKVLVEFDTLPDSPDADFNEMVYFKVPMAPEAEDQTPMEMGFGLFKDPRFSDLDDVIEYYSPYIDESLILRLVDNRNGLQEGDLVDDDDVHVSIPVVLEFQNKLYVAPLTWYKELKGIKIKEINENDFVVTVTTSHSGNTYIMDVTISKTDFDNFMITNREFIN